MASGQRMQPRCGVTLKKSYHRWVFNECPIVSADAALFTKHIWLVEIPALLPYCFIYLFIFSQKINNSKVRLLFLQILYDYSHATNNYCTANTVFSHTA